MRGLALSTADSSHGNPQRISEREFILLLALLSASSALATDMVLPAFADMRSDFGLPSDATEVSLTLTVFFIGSGFGQLFYGPAVDAFGRKPVLLFSMSLYSIAALVSALAPTLGVLYVARFVWGLAAAGPRVLTQAIVRDRFVGDAMARVMTLIQTAFFIAPIVAPIIGAGVVQISGWRMVMAVGVLISLVTGMWSLRLQETLAAENRRSLSPTAIFGSFRLVVESRITVAYTGAVTFAFAAFYSFLGSLELIFGEVYDRASWFVPYFSVISVFFAGVAVIANRMLRRMPAWKWALTAGSGLFITSAALLVVTVAAGGKPPFVVWLVLFSLANACHVAFFPSGNSLALEPMGSLAGTAASAVGFTTAIVGAFLASFIDRAISDDVLPIGLGYFGFTAASLLFQLWARQLRADPS